MMGGGSDDGGGRGNEVLMITESSASCFCRWVCVFERINDALSPNLEGASKISNMGARMISSGSAGRMQKPGVLPEWVLKNGQVVSGMRMEGYGGGQTLLDDLWPWSIENSREDVISCKCYERRVYKEIRPRKYREI